MYVVLTDDEIIDRRNMDFDSISIRVNKINWSHQLKETLPSVAQKFLASLNFTTSSNFHYEPQTQIPVYILFVV